ncbi:MAG: translation initiation factor eIF-2B [Anaerolineae bacterium]|nr:translation initiation factor eIF-2B [Anaerolineae bacterium]
MDEEPRSFAQWLEFLRTDRAHGAGQLAQLALRGMIDQARVVSAESTTDLITTLSAQAEQMAAVRPSMAPLYNLLTRWRAQLEQLHDADLAQARTKATERGERILIEAAFAGDRVADHAAALLDGHRTLITHSYSSTVLKTFSALRRHDVRAIVTESRPLYEGHQMARQLTQWGIGTTLITDAQLGLAVADADVVLVGADTVLADGAVVNKVGTYLLALAAHDKGVPFYVCCESFKQADTTQPHLEAMPPKELAAPDLPHLAVQNIYFDVTPARLITGWIDENGFRPNR